MNINVQVVPTIINVTVIEEPIGIKYDSVTIQNLAVRELQTVRTGTTVVERTRIAQGFGTDVYYVTLNNILKGDPISIHVHYSDQDVELLTQWNVSANKASFISVEDVSNLYCTVVYLY